MGKEYRFGETMITEEQLAKRAEELGRQISDDYKGEEVLCIGILKGSVMFMADLIKNITVEEIQSDYFSYYLSSHALLPSSSLPAISLDRKSVV